MKPPRYIRLVQKKCAHVKVIQKFIISGISLLNCADSARSVLTLYIKESVVIDCCSSVCLLMLLSGVTFGFFSVKNP